jgi:hypothetical protein
MHSGVVDQTVIPTKLTGHKGPNRRSPICTAETQSTSGVLNTRSPDVFCAARVHFYKTYCVNLYDEKSFPDVREHVLLM